MNNTKPVRFQLIGELRPPNYQIPLKNMMLPKTVNGQRVQKRVHYIPGVESVYVEDYKGDEKPKEVWMSDGFLDVHPDNKPLIFLLKNHRWFNKKFELVDSEAKALKELDQYDAIENALEKVNVTSDDEAQAIAVVIIGEGMLSKSNTEIRAALKRMAHKEAKTLLHEMVKPDYKARYVAALGLMKGVVLTNAGQTAVTWSDGKVIVTVPVGKKPVDVLGSFLSENSEQSMITLQEIQTLIKRSYVKNVPVTAENEINDIIEEKTLTDTLPTDQNDVVLDPTKDEPPISLEEARRLYKEMFEKDVANNKKNDLAWILAQLNS